MAQQLVRASDRAKDIEQLFTINVEAMARQAPKTTGDPLRLIRVAYNAIAFDRDLVECTRESLIGGVMEAVKLGITLGGPMQEGWLIPFRDGRSDKKIATLLVGYMGLRNIIDRGGSVIDLQPRAVYKHDEFDFEFGNQPRIRHRPWWMVGASEKGELTCVYAVARLRRGGVQLEVMPVSEVEEHRQRSRAKDSGPWKTDYDAMALKTVLRKISKYLPKSSELLARALDLDDKADRGVPQDFDVSGFILPPDPEQKEKAPGQTGAKLAALTNTLATKHPLGGQVEAPEGTLSAEENAALDRAIAEREGSL